MFNANDELVPASYLPPLANYPLDNRILEALGQNGLRLPLEESKRSEDFPPLSVSAIAMYDIVTVQQTELRPRMVTTPETVVGAGQPQSYNLGDLALLMGGGNG